MFSSLISLTILLHTAIEATVIPMAQVMKYKEDLNGFTDCPPSDFKQSTLIAYRGVLSNPPSPACFQPVLKRDPQRILRTNDRQKCSGFGLSFFVSLEALQTKFHELKPDFPNLEKTFGAFAAEGQLDAGDGIMGEANRHGHFTFHEFGGTELWKKFQVVKELGV